MIIRKGVRTVIWIIIVILICFVLFPFLKPQYIFHQVMNNPLLREFKRCKLVSYDFNIENRDPFTLMDLYARKYIGIDLFYIDTLSKYGIQYKYKINVQLNDYKMTRVWFERAIEISDSCSMTKVIKEVESDSALVELIKNSDVTECHYERPNFVYTGRCDVIKYNNPFGIMYFRLAKLPVQLHLLSYYVTFLNMVKEKGFSYSDFDSIRFIKYSEIPSNSKTVISVWRLQGFAVKFENDFVEVGNYGLPVNLKWLSIPDSIDPIFLESRVLKQLYAAGLPKDYIQKKLILQETGATRLADYYKRGQKIIDASRVVGYYQYQWLTGTWIDKVHGGLRIKVYFTYFMDHKDLELVRIGLSTSNFHEGIRLHPITEVIDFNEIKQVAPDIDTTNIGFKITNDGRMMFTFVYNKYEYEVDAKTGTFRKQIYVRGMTCILPYDRHLYSEMEWSVNNRRKRRR